MTFFKVSLSVGAMILAAAGLGSIAAAQDRAPGDDTFESIVGDDCDGERCIAVGRGLFDFVDRRLHGLKGNGRACADCHMLSDHFQLSPANVEARFQNLQARRLENPHADDPLFRPVDANDYRINGESASDFSNLRQNALIRITFPLPANVKLLDCGATVPCPRSAQPTGETSVDVWRMVPTVNNVKLTGPDGLDPWPRGPNPSGGYQLDGRFATLQQQALGALTVHAEIQVAPQQGMLDDLSAFESVLFSSRGVRRLSNAVSAGVTPLPDADPPLNELEQAGKVVFARACGQCHGGPGQSTPQAPVIRFHDISTQCPRPVDTGPLVPRYVFKPCPASLARNVRSYEITVTSPTGSSTIRRTSSDPGRALLTGFAGVGPPATDDWNKFDIPSLRGISKTAPYFHDNSAATLEDVVDHYMVFFDRVLVNVRDAFGLTVKLPPAISTDGMKPDRKPHPEEIPALLAYLRKL
jgi:cytochrome c peroxidase